jgi:transcriptional regulator with XRE-family HTH domain
MALNSFLTVTPDPGAPARLTRVAWRGTQAGLAKEAGIPRQRVALRERGSCFPAAATRLAHAKTLRVDEDTLFPARPPGAHMTDNPIKLTVEQLLPSPGAR